MSENICDLLQCESRGCNSQLICGARKKLIKHIDDKCALAVKNERDAWTHELAYFTKEDIATPEGVKDWIPKAIETAAKNAVEEYDKLLFAESLGIGTVFVASDSAQRKYALSKYKGDK